MIAAKADAAWVGWGFVAEDAGFAELCDRIGRDVHRSAAGGDAPARRQGARRSTWRRRPGAGGAVERRPGGDME